MALLDETAARRRAGDKRQVRPGGESKSARALKVPSPAMKRLQALHASLTYSLTY